jgi:exopolyphosphatase/guanosine-5'-triphosphate,3'-diphosphate pyrophosphatase
VRHVISIATSAVREAHNNEDFLQEVFKKTGFKFTVLSGEEEALYSYLGALQSTCIPTALFFDLGGGSLELVYSENYKIRKVISLPLGTLRLSQAYCNVEGKLSKKNYSKLEEHLIRELPNRKELEINVDTILIGVGGTLRAISRYNQETTKYQLEKIHNYRISLDHIHLINDKLREMSPLEIAEIGTVGSNRAATITVGSCIMKVLMQKLEFENILVSARGLREGVLSTFLCLAKGHSLHDFSIHQIQNLVKCSCKPEKIPQYARAIITRFYNLGLLKEREYEILAHSIKILPDLPVVTNLHNMFHIIIDEDIRHLSHREQLILALSIVRTKKAKTANALFTKFGSILQPQNRKSIEKISSCLSLSIILERYKTKVRFVKYSQKEIVVTFIPEKNNDLPLTLLEEVVNSLRKALAISIIYSISPKR